MIDIGSCIIAQRERKRMKQKELARRAEMSAAQLCHIENNRVSPSICMVERIANALDMDVAELVSGKNGSRVKSVSEPLGIEHIAKTKCEPIRSTEPDAGRALKLIAEEDAKRDEMERQSGIRSGCSLALNRAGVNYDGAGAALADVLRAELGLGTAAAIDLATALEFRGFRIYRRKLSSKVGSVAFWNLRNDAPIIVLNESVTEERGLYRLAYELGSFCLYISMDGRRLDETLVEHRFLTDFAAAFLMPGVTMHEYVLAAGIGPGDWTFERLVAMKSAYHVSAESFALRLEELGLIIPKLRLKLRDRLRDYYRKHPKTMEPHPRKSSGLRWQAMKDGRKSQKIYKKEGLPKKEPLDRLPGDLNKFYLNL